MVTMLLQGGVDMDARDEDGQSPLLLAVRGRYQGPGCCSRHEEVDGRSISVGQSGRASWRRWPQKPASLSGLMQEG